MLQERIVRNPTLKDPSKFIKELWEKRRRILPVTEEEEKLDKAGLDALKARLQKESKLFKVR